MIGDRHDIAASASGHHLGASAQGSVDINVRCGAGCGGIRNSQSRICPLPLPDKRPAESPKEQGIFPIRLPPMLLLPKRRIRRPTPGTRCIDRSNSSSKGSCVIPWKNRKLQRARPGEAATASPVDRIMESDTGSGGPALVKKLSETSTCSAWARVRQRRL